MYISVEKYINILAVEMASPGNWHSANCIGAPSFPITAKERKIFDFSKVPV